MDSSDLREQMKNAVRRKDLAKVKLILSTGFDVNSAITDFKGKNGTFLHLASNSEITRELLLHGADVNASDGNCLTPLHYAVIYGKGLPVVRVLLSFGADVNAQNCEGVTPLTFAVLFGLENIIVELINHNADYNIQIASSCINYSSALDIAVGDYENFAKLIIKTYIMKSFKEGNCKIIDLEPYREFKNFKCLSTYQDDCMKEIKRIESFEVGQFLLRDFLLNKKYQMKPLYSRGKNILEEINRIFPIYSSTILPLVRKSVIRRSLLDVFENLKISSEKTTINEHVFLDPDSLPKIGGYLSNADLKNVAQAFNVTISKVRYMSMDELEQEMRTSENAIKRCKYK